MRRLLAMGALALAACGPTTDGPDGGDPAIPCATQTDCSSERRKVCEDGFCSAQLADNSDHFRDLSLDLATGVKLQGPQALRVFVVYPVTPNGDTVLCDEIASYEELNDPARFNLTASPLEIRILQPNDVIQTGIFVNGPGRVVYAEIYNAQLNDSPQRIGIGCVEDVPESGRIIVDVKAVAG